MKRSALSIPVLAVIFFLFSCKPDANDPLDEQLQAYKWKIPNMTYLGEDKSPEFELYIFDFINANELTAAKDDSTFTGTWQRTGGSENNPSITINFGSHHLLQVLNAQWLQDERTDQAVIFSTEDDSSSVTFEIVP